VSGPAVPIDLTIDVTDAVGLGEPHHTCAVVVLPDPSALGAVPVVCFGFPGAGYSRGYYTFDMPGSSHGGEAGWHAARGWIYVGCDHLGVGGSSAPSDPLAATFEVMAAANHATVTEVLRRLADGSLADGFPPVLDPVVLGAGQSTGGCFTVVQQGQHATFDGIAVLGFSAIQMVDLMPPGAEDLGTTFFPRNTFTPVSTPGATFDPASLAAVDESGLPAIADVFHFDDVPREIVERDLVDYPERRGGLPEWASATIPAAALFLRTPGVIMAEAAVITAPVFVGVGERDLIPNPREEPRAYQRSPDVMVCICPRMAHMHNFAGTRERFWQRLHHWGDGVAASR